MGNKTLIITYKPSVAKYLGETLDDDIKAESGGYLEGYLEGNTYVITWASVDFVEDYVSAEFELDDQKPLRDLILEVRDTPYHVNRGQLGKYNERFFITKELICREDIDTIIWYASKDAPHLAMFDFCYRWMGCPMKKNRFCFDSSGELGHYLPVTELKSERVMKRYYEAMRYSSLRESMFSSFFNKTIELISNKKYMTNEYRQFVEFNEFDIFMMRIIYGKPMKHYSVGWVFVEVENLMENRVLDYFSTFPMSGSFSNLASTTEKLWKRDLIGINKRTQRISHTKYGQQIYETVMDYLPDYGDIKNHIYWRKQANKIIQGKITGEEYLKEAHEHVRKALTGLM